MAFQVYMLRWSDGRSYTGQTNDLDRRISEHQNGNFCNFTIKRLRVTLMWSESFGSRIEALEAEQRIKPWSRAKKGELIRGDWKALSFYSRPPHKRPTTSLGTNGDCVQPLKEREGLQ
jgi:predicted GIY-YIG superfamily endonuclease